ncbi:MAG: M67 family metallopeptidase [Selenomonadaceae bacterium]|nr:M67 family metallopeptidase [Selenomonadaceae bacterium]
MMIILTESQFNEIVDHAKKQLPNEDCGLLGGIIDENKKIVKKIYFLTNIDKSPEHFSMDAKEQFSAIKDMRSNNFILLGNFHSHPNSPSRMSEEDKRLAFDKKLSYLILSLAENEPILKSFKIDENKQVEQEELQIK